MLAKRQVLGSVIQVIYYRREWHARRGEGALLGCGLCARARDRAGTARGRTPLEARAHEGWTHVWGDAGAGAGAGRARQAWRVPVE